MKQILLSLSLLFVLAGCGQSAAPEAPQPSPKPEQTEQAQQPKPEGAVSEPAVPTIRTETYAVKNCKVEYPQLSGLRNALIQDTVNGMIAADISSLIRNFDVNAEGAEMETVYSIRTLDTGLLSVTYEGSYNAKDAAYPISVFASTNIDLLSGARIRFPALSSPEETANWLTGENAQVSMSADKETADAQNEYIHGLSQDELIKTLESADFGDTEDFPEAFSYVDANTVFVSLQVPHALGDHGEFLTLTQYK